MAEDKWPYANHLWNLIKDRIFTLFIPTFFNNFDNTIKFKIRSNFYRYWSNSIRIWNIRVNSSNSCLCACSPWIVAIYNMSCMGINPLHIYTIFNFFIKYLSELTIIFFTKIYYIFYINNIIKNIINILCKTWNVRKVIWDLLIILKPDY